ncbi:MAG: TolC family protein [Capnocytophaga sp.]|nr:TolC family protein [Capnocytophaga sp.]
MNRIVILIFLLWQFVITANAQEISLEQAKKYALENNNQVKNSHLEIGIAEDMKREAQTHYLPKLSAMGFVAKTFDPLLDLNTEAMNLPVYDGNPQQLPNATQFAYVPPISLSIDRFATAAITLMQPIYSGNRVNNANKLAAINKEAKTLQQQLTLKEISLKTEKEYRQVLTLNAKKITLGGYEDFLEKLHNEVNNAVKSGLAIRNDLLKVSIKQSELKLKRIELENGIELASKQLCQTIGMDYNAGIRLSDELILPVSPQSLYIDSDTALSQREEYQLLEKSVAAAQLETKMKKGGNLPTIVAGISGFYMDTMDNTLNAKTNGAVFGGVSIPISNWWENRHGVNQQKAKEQIAVNQRNETNALLKLQIDKAWTDLNVAFENIALSEEIVSQTQENLRVNVSGYRNGLTPLSDLLDAQAQANEAQERLIESKVNYQTAITTYLTVTGR